jgi:hypothetical protein
MMTPRWNLTTIPRSVVYRSRESMLRPDPFARRAGTARAKCVGAQLLSRGLLSWVWALPKMALFG